MSLCGIKSGLFRLADEPCGFDQSEAGVYAHLAKTTKHLALADRVGAAWGAGRAAHAACCIARGCTPA